MHDNHVHDEKVNILGDLSLCQRRVKETDEEKIEEERLDESRGRRVPEGRSVRTLLEGRFLGESEEKGVHDKKIENEHLGEKIEGEHLGENIEGEHLGEKIEGEHPDEKNKKTGKRALSEENVKNKPERRVRKRTLSHGAILMKWWRLFCLGRRASHVGRKGRRTRRRTSPRRTRRRVSTGGSGVT